MRSKSNIMYFIHKYTFFLTVVCIIRISLCVPVLYAHWRYLICISWPADGCNATETCSHELLILLHFYLCILLLFCLTWIYIYIYTFTYVISNFRRDLNIVYILLGISPASNCSWPTFRNPVSVPSSKAGCRLWGVKESREIYTRVRV